MAIKDIFKVSFKTFFNPTAWLGAHELRRNTRVMGEVLKNILVPRKALRKETFQQAMYRQGLTEKELVQVGHKYFANAIIFVLLAIASFLASFYYLFHHNTFSGWMLCIAVTALFAVQGFRFHFWYFQIKQKKLGCTLREWWQGKTEE